MISRRDNLLIKPWDDKKFENHRRKVQSASSTIDNRPPLYRPHVAIKSKKQQKEYERVKKIERDNYLLFKKLNYIMSTNKVDNNWKTPQPNFLNRISIYNTVVPKLEDIRIDDFDQHERVGSGIRKFKCSACTPKDTPEMKVPEERVPWEPAKEPVGRFRSKSVPPRKIAPTVDISNIQKPKKEATTRAKTSIPKNRETKKNITENFKDVRVPQSILLSRGSLKLAVNFPSDTYVKLTDGSNEKLIKRGLCCCKILSDNLAEVF